MRMRSGRHCATAVYSFGVLLWCLYSRSYPYRNVRGSLLAVLLRVHQGQRPALADFPPALAALIARCWHRDPQARPEFEQILGGPSCCGRPTGSRDSWSR